MSPTPKDKPKLLNEWVTKEKEYMSRGMSRYQAVKKIANDNHVAQSTVYRWLREPDTEKLYSWLKLEGDYVAKGMTCLQAQIEISREYKTPIIIVKRHLDEWRDMLPVIESMARGGLL